MAQSLIALPSETVFAECRAFVFFYDIQQNRWSEVAEPNVYSRIQLLCSRPPGSTGLYRILGRLETSGMVRSIANWLIKRKVYTLFSLNLFHMWRTEDKESIGNQPPRNMSYFTILCSVLLHQLCCWPVDFFHCCYAVHEDGECCFLMKYHTYVSLISTVVLHLSVDKCSTVC